MECESPTIVLVEPACWTTKHRAIALKQCHISQVHREPSTEEESRAQRFHLPEEHFSERHDSKESIITEATTREDNNRKIAMEGKKRSAPENHSSSSSKNAKKRKAKRVVQEKARRNEQEAADRRNEDELSDMSISPSHTGDCSREITKSELPLGAFKTPRESYQTSTGEPSNQRSGLDFEAISERGRTTSVVEEDNNDIARRYITPSRRDALFSSSSHSWSDMIGNPDCLIQNTKERYPGYNSLDTFSRNSYVDGYGRSLDADRKTLQTRPYSLQREDDSLQRSRFVSGISDSALGRNDIFPSSSYGLLSSVGESAMQRYAPQFSVPSFPRASENPGQGEPNLGGRSNIFDMPGMRRDIPPDSFGFPPGHQHPFQRRGSGGWTDD